METSGGIGRAIAKKFGQAQAKLALNDIAPAEENLKKLAEELGGKYFLGDVSKLEEMEKVIEKIQKEFSRLDVLVNNAGICQDRTLAKMTKEEWQKVIDIDLIGVFNCSKPPCLCLSKTRGKLLAFLPWLVKEEISVRQITPPPRPALLALPNPWLKRLED